MSKEGLSEDRFFINSKSLSLVCSAMRYSMRQASCLAIFSSTPKKSLKK